ncbi:MAG TPA: VOC family protein, partial [Acidimicrobiales bacterium]|nr:VOC family protein [Acidimicrobiales bacterium]
MQVLGLHHVSINVDDVGAARTFYCDVLGLEERKDRPDFSFDGAWLDAGGQQIHLIAAEVPADLGQHLALWVGDLDA